MINIVFDILSGTLPITANISPNVAADQIISSYGTYSFDAIPDGEYIITIVDAGGCISRSNITTSTTTTSHTTAPILPCTLLGELQCNTLLPTTTTTTTTPLQCNTLLSNSYTYGINEYTIPLYPIGGVIVFEFNPFSIGDKVEILHNSVKKATTGMTVLNEGPFDSVYGDPLIPDLSAIMSIDQFIGTSKGVIPTRYTTFISESGVSDFTLSMSQLIWWIYSPSDYNVNNSVTIRITALTGGTWDIRRLCPASITPTTSTSTTSAPLVLPCTLLGNIICDYSSTTSTSSSTTTSTTTLNTCNLYSVVDSVNSFNTITLTFDNISNANTLIGGSPNNVSLWNTLFNLPTDGTAFTSVVVDGDSVSLIGGSGISLKNHIFENNIHLLSFIDNSSVTSVGTYCFSGCSNITNITIPLTIYAGDFAFSHCDSTFSLPGLQTTGINTFEYCSYVSSLPSLVTAGNFCFYSATITHLDLPSLTTAGTQAFMLTNLISIYCPNLTSLGTYCFGSNYNLEGITLPNITTISDYAFANCLTLAYAYCPKVTIISNYAFQYCTSLKSLNFPLLTSISQGVFYSCTSLISINFPILSTAGINALNLQSHITSISLPLLTTCSFACFADNQYVTSFNLPLLNSIGDNSFSGCIASTSIYIPSCLNLGSSVANNNVFNLITGKTIHLTIPIALMTCDSGSPDGDIQYLSANNTVTITTV